MARAKVWVVTSREYLERVRTRWFVIATVFFPIIFGLLLFLPPWLASRSRPSADLPRIAILDATGTTLGTRVAAELNGGLAGDTARTHVRAVSLEALPAAEQAATRETIAGAIRGYLVLDTATLAGRRARYAGTNATVGADMDKLQSIVRTQTLALQLERAGLDPVRSASLTNTRLTLEAERITEHGRGGAARISILFAFGVGFVLYIMIVMYGQAVLRGVIEEKQTRVAEVVVASVSPAELLAGKMLGVGAMGLTQMLVWIGVGVILTKARGVVLAHFGIQGPPLHLPEISVGAAAVLVLFFLLGYAFYAALFAGVGATVSNEQDAQQAQAPVVMLLVATVIFLAPILAAPEGTLAVLLGWLPFSAPIVMPLRMSVVSVPPTQIAGSLLVLAASCYVAVRGAARIYRTGLLMYGKRVTLREAIRWARQAR